MFITMPSGETFRVAVTKTVDIPNRETAYTLCVTADPHRGPPLFTTQVIVPDEWIAASIDVHSLMSSLEQRLWANVWLWMRDQPCFPHLEDAQ